MRTAIRAAILADATLIGLGVVDTGVLAGDVDSFADRPFLNLKWGVRNPGMATETATALTIWVHDDPNDYARIAAICARLSVLLPSIVGLADPVSGGWVSQVRWDGDSSDLSDDGHRTIVKQCNFTIIGSA
jgi:hypothetical protein